MITWTEMARQNRAAAHDLFNAQRWRGCVNRAYYAVYSGCAAALLKIPTTMPHGREGPHHIPLPELIGYNLTSLRMANRWRLADLVRQLYILRCIADYRPSVDVEEPESRIAVGLMNRAFLLLDRVP